MEIELKVEAVSPLHLGGGQGDVNIDAEVICDRYGIPYFPGRRFKGLLYESAKEVGEMMARSGQELPATETLDELFHHDTDAVDAQLIIPNLYMWPRKEYQQIRRGCAALQRKYPGLFTPRDILEQYTSLRYQTKLTNGIAAEGSLHNMRVVDEGLTFTGIMELTGENAPDYLPLLALATRNLRRAGLKRNRGFGRLACSFTVLDGSRKGQRDASLIKEVWR
ncbi:MAG: hypothetical protein IJ849_01705 [Selenomonadaceae bacterium]|nr:hypothetical protein [Selenomonadaceae bacterium]